MTEPKVRKEMVEIEMVDVVCDFTKPFYDYLNEWREKEEKQLGKDISMGEYIEAVINRFTDACKEQANTIAVLQAQLNGKHQLMAKETDDEEAVKLLNEIMSDDPPVDPAFQ